jgi:hypothetical protein
MALQFRNLIIDSCIYFTRTAACTSLIRYSRQRPETDADTPWAPLQDFMKRAATCSRTQAFPDQILTD